MKKPYKRFVALFCIALLVVQLAGCQTNSGLVLRQPVESEQVSGATETPDFSGNVTDLRLWVNPRTLYFSSHITDVMLLEYEDLLLEQLECNYLQIIYSYKMDGVWHDIPAENYNLKGIFSCNEGKNGYDAAKNGHIVQIGPYVLICLTWREGVISAIEDGQVYDSLDSELYTPFKEYHSSSDSPNQIAEYGFCREALEKRLFRSEFTLETSTGFDERYYIILERDKITDDYKLTCGDYELTAEEIFALLDS